ncbi:cytochrome c oxidase assembly protein [Sphingomonas sanguinis]|uniref:cytochrome c oxidase assembly protein n=1 Tax=Sphingomonas sp. LC-1 TaxID=3110957 RepID=UPI0021BB9A65|nr:cytochrome c oxidase assembly protein [Sphingomonas sp. LC-1]MCT8003619.1 cytochrome c oxidase assembly protein [Sphingomonas sp. LC-1]
MTRVYPVAGLALLAFGWTLSGQGMTGHMVAHMIAVAIAAPLLALGIQGSPIDPARRWPRLATPLVAALVEAVIVWGWHVPALRRLADHAPLWLIAEQASFLAAGLLLWSAVLAPQHRAAGIAALLVTSMHMTLLGALIGLAPRPLYSHHGAGAMQDQQIAGVVMLLVGGIAYLCGGLGMLGRLLQSRPEARA